MTTQLRTERLGATLVFTLDGPSERNALSSAVYAAGVEALGVAESSTELRSVVLTGEGGYFSAGDQLQEIADSRARPAAQAERMDALGRWIEALRAFPKPVIAAVEGVAAGAACSLALACDLIVAARGAKFSLAYGRLGLAPEGGITHLLGQTMSRQMALEWLWLAQSRDAQELRTLGLVNHVVEPGHALAVALALCEQLNAMSPGTVSACKELMNRAGTQTLAQQLQLERELFVQTFSTSDAAEGLAAWREQREPNFRVPG
jgi:enoyl-CoA hydratase/carnithine racemase